MLREHLQCAMTSVAFSGALPIRHRSDRYGEAKRTYLVLPNQRYQMRYQTLHFRGVKRRERKKPER
jgi:hypothetical protein